MNKIQKFIEDNELDFDGTGSELNSNCCILAGFACYMGITNGTDLIDRVVEEDEDSPEITGAGITELRRVFDFAYSNGYGAFWSSTEAKDMYEFELLEEDD